jgi:hypothetical protein
MGEDGLLYGGTKEVILPYGQIPHILTPAQREDVPSILRMLAETSESKDWQSLRTIANVLEGRTPVDKAFGLIRREATYQVQSMARYMLENPQKELCKFLISTRQVSLLATYKG